MATRNLQILIADDSHDDASFLMRAFREKESPTCTFVHLMDGEAALAGLTDGQKFDLIVLDYYLPRQTALEVVTKLQTLQSSPTCPIVVLSSYLPPVRVRELGEVGIDRVLQKPADWQSYQELVELLLRMTDN